MPIKDTIKALLEGIELDDALRDLLEHDARLRDAERKWKETDNSNDFRKYMREMVRAKEAFDISAHTLKNLPQYFQYNLNFQDGSGDQLTSWVRGGIHHSRRTLNSTFEDMQSMYATFPKRRQIVAVGLIGQPQSKEPMMDTICIVYRWLHVRTFAPQVDGEGNDVVPPPVNNVTAYACLVTDAHQAGIALHEVAGIVTTIQGLLTREVWNDTMLSNLFSARTEGMALIRIAQEINREYSGGLLWIPEAHR